MLCYVYFYICIPSVKALILIQPKVIALNVVMLLVIVTRLISRYGLRHFLLVGVD